MYPDFNQYLRMQNLFGTQDPSTGMFPMPNSSYSPQSGVMPDMGTGISMPPVPSMGGMPTPAQMQPQPVPQGPTPYDVDARMRDLYHPDTTFSDRFAQMMGNYPKQAEASTGRKILGGALGALTDVGNAVGAIGHGSTFRTMAGPRTGQEVYDEVTGRKKFLEDVQDWRNQIGPIEQAANIERMNNTNQRMMAHQIIGSELARQKEQDTNAINQQKVDVSKSRAAIYAMKANQPDIRFDFKGPTVLAADSKTGKVTDTGIPTAHLSDEDKMTLQQSNTLEQISAKGDEARLTQKEKEAHADTLAWSDPLKVEMPDGTTKYVQTNRVSGQVREVALPGVASKIGTPGQNTQKVTPQTQAIMEGSKMLLPHVGTLRAQAEALDKMGLFGPVMSRIRDLAGKVGTTGSPEEVQANLEKLATDITNDPALNKDFAVGQFASNLGLMTSGMGRVHGGARGGGSIQMVNYLKSLLSSDSTLPMFKGRLSTFEDYLKGYAAGPNATSNDKIGSALDKIFGPTPTEKK